MKSLLYRLGWKPRNFDDFSDYCINNSAPKSVRLKYIRKTHNKLAHRPFTFYINKVKFIFDDFSFKKYYDNKGELEQDIKIFEDMGISFDNDNLEAVLNAFVS